MTGRLGEQGSCPHPQPSCSPGARTGFPASHVHRPRHRLPRPGAAVRFLVASGAVKENVKTGWGLRQGTVDAPPSTVSPLIQHDRHRPINTPNLTAYRGATASPTTPATRERS
jgi:hypothetical protein